MIEEWRNVIGYEGLYQVSNLGRIKRSYKTTLDRILVNYGLPYPHVKLRRNRTSYDVTVHSLVMQAFVGPRPDGFEVNHIDRDGQNNRLDNLEYILPIDNKLRGEQHYTAKLTEQDVYFIRSGNHTPKELASIFECSINTIYSILERRNWVHI